MNQEIEQYTYIIEFCGLTKTENGFQIIMNGKPRIIEFESFQISIPKKSTDLEIIKIFNGTRGAISRINGNPPYNCYINVDVKKNAISLIEHILIAVNNQINIEGKKIIMDKTELEYYLDNGEFSDGFKGLDRF
jgi:hypothetical protein